MAGKGRAKVPEMERHNRTLYVFLRDEERGQVERQAAQDGLSLSAFARRAVLKELRRETNIVERGRPQGKAAGQA